MNPATDFLSQKVSRISINLSKFQLPEEHQMRLSLYKHPSLGQYGSLYFSLLRLHLSHCFFSFSTIQNKMTYYLLCLLD